MAHNHFSDTRHPDGAPLPVPFEVWPVYPSEVQPPHSPMEPTRPHRWKYSVALEPREIAPHADPPARQGALGTAARAAVPFKIDRWDDRAGFWITEWHAL